MAGRGAVGGGCGLGGGVLSGSGLGGVRGRGSGGFDNPAGSGWVRRVGLGGRGWAAKAWRGHVGLRWDLAGQVSAGARPAGWFASGWRGREFRAVVGLAGGLHRLWCLSEAPKSVRMQYGRAMSAWRCFVVDLFASRPRFPPFASAFLSFPLFLLSSSLLSLSRPPVFFPFPSPSLSLSLSLSLSFSFFSPSI